MKQSILVIAGEISGDMHAAQVVRAIKKRSPETTFWGIGGDELRAEGVELLQNVDKMAVMGFSAVFKNIAFFIGVFLQILRAIKTRKPTAAILVDYPGFNLRMAKQLKKQGVKVFYYVCPQVWAWHSERIPVMAKIIDHLMVIFPFEVDVFKHTPLQVDYVGHPLVAEIDRFLLTEPRELPWTTEERKIALLPGSRHQEVVHILPVMLETAQMLEHESPEASFIIPVPNKKVEADVLQQIAQSAKKPKKLEVVRGMAREVLRQADAALVTSGTATLETALIGCPMVVMYKARALTVYLARKLVDIKFICIVNIIADRKIVTELIQQDASPATLTKEIKCLLNDTPERSAMLAGYAEVREILGNREAGETVAEIVLNDM